MERATSRTMFTWAREIPSFSPQWTKSWCVAHVTRIGKAPSQPRLHQSPAQLAVGSPFHGDLIYFVGSLGNVEKVLHLRCCVTHCDIDNLRKAMQCACWLYIWPGWMQQRSRSSNPLATFPFPHIYTLPPIYIIVLPVIFLNCTQLNLAGLAYTFATLHIYFLSLSAVFTFISHSTTDFNLPFSI